MMSAQNVCENPYATFWLADGILFWTYKPQVVLTVRVAQRVVADRLWFQNEKAFPILCDIRGVVRTEKAGRDYLAQYGSSLATAVAILTDHVVMNTVSNFYINITKPFAATKHFSCETEALKYLNQFK